MIRCLCMTFQYCSKISLLPHLCSLHCCTHCHLEFHHPIFSTTLKGVEDFSLITKELIIMADIGDVAAMFKEPQIYLNSVAVEFWLILAVGLIAIITLRSTPHKRNCSASARGHACLFQWKKRYISNFKEA
jgi:hypothetical protein